MYVTSSSESDSDDDVIGIQLLGRAQGGHVRQRTSTNGDVSVASSNNRNEHIAAPAALDLHHLMAAPNDPANAILVAAESSLSPSVTATSSNHLDVGWTQMGGFLNRKGTAICSRGHALALIGLIQLGTGHPDGLVGSFRHNNRRAWITNNLDAFFREDGPLGAYVPISANV